MGINYHSSRLDGELHILPFEGGSLATRISKTYQNLLTEQDSIRDILILKRFPSDIENFADELASAAGTVSRPNVKSITRHAETIITRARPEIDTISDEQRIEILAQAIKQHKFQDDYLEQASNHDSFGRDVGRILLAATWQGGFEFPDETELNEYDEHLRELKRINDRFHEEYLQRGQQKRIEKAAQIVEASRLLEDADKERKKDLLDNAYDVVLVAEFEEFGSIERQYLSLITEDVDLVCVGEENSSIQRVWNEPGAIDSLAPTLDQMESSPTSESINSQIDAIAHYLSTGDSPKTTDSGSVFTIKADTFEDQLREIANEIEYLRNENDWQYDDFAVLFKDSTGPIPEARRILRHAGVPTASTSVSGLGEDLAVRELYTLARYYTNKPESARPLLEARVGGISDDLFKEVSQKTGLHDKLSTWIIETDLKRRIAEDVETVDAYAQNQNIKKVLQIAEFIDETDFLPPTWPTFISVLERAITFVTPDQYATDLEAEENGVAVDPVRVFKQNQRKVVFLCNVVEGTYPADQNLTDLFPQSWVKKMNHYPGVTTPTPDDVTETFDTAKDVRAPYSAYYRELARRQLAIGVRAASDRLYFCTANHSSESHSNRTHPSRFLTELQEHDAFEFIEIGSEDAPRDIYTQGQVSNEILCEPWRQFERVQSAASTGDKVTLKETKQMFGAIQALLAESDELDPRFELAVDTQIDFALGEVRTDE